LRSPIQDAGAPEANAVQTEAADEIEMPLPSNPQTFFVGGLFGLGVLAAVYVASSIILPVVLAFVLELILQPRPRRIIAVQRFRASTHHLTGEPTRGGDLRKVQSTRKLPAGGNPVKFHDMA
jgi:hypothetical protein